MSTGTCLNDYVLGIISAACPEFEQACQLVELIDAAWHKVEEEEKLSRSSVSLFFTDKSSWISALNDVHNGDETTIMPRTLETAAGKVYSTCATAYLNRSLRTAPDKDTVTSLVKRALCLVLSLGWGPATRPLHWICKKVVEATRQSPSRRLHRVRTPATHTMTAWRGKIKLFSEFAKGQAQPQTNSTSSKSSGLTVGLTTSPPLGATHSAL